MKIPSKQQVSVQIADQKRHQVAEGLVIARKIDVMRDSLLNLERNQKSFIEQSTKELTEATDKLFTKKTVLEREIKEAEIKLAELRKPLDEEWKRLDTDKEDLKRSHNSLEALREDLNKEVMIVSDKEEKLDRITKKTLLLLQETEQNNNQSKINKEESEIILKDAKTNRDEIEKECADRLLEVSIKEEKINFDLQANEHIKEINERKEKELNIRERQINDKYQQLLKTQDELNSKRPKQPTSSRRNTK